MLLKLKWASAFMVFGLLVAMQSFAATSVEGMIDKNDHRGLANYYEQQANELQGKAKHWEHTAEVYEKHSDPKTKADSDQHAAHCRAIAQSYAKAADEAGALAREHGKLPVGESH